jgi:hypothetical protein
MNFHPELVEGWRKIKPCFVIFGLNKNEGIRHTDDTDLMDAHGFILLSQHFGIFLYQRTHYLAKAELISVLIR